MKRHKRIQNYFNWTLTFDNALWLKMNILIKRHDNNKCNQGN